MPQRNGLTRGYFTASIEEVDLVETYNKNAGNAWDLTITLIIDVLHSAHLV